MDKYGYFKKTGTRVPPKEEDDDSTVSTNSHADLKTRDLKVQKPMYTKKQWKTYNEIKKTLKQRATIKPVKSKKKNSLPVYLQYTVTIYKTKNSKLSK